MARTNYKELLEAGVHFGHLKRKWNPKMSPYIFMERKGIHIIDLNKTVAKLEEACAALKQIAKSGKKVLFVATKKQAKDIISEKIGAVNMPFVTERWPGGMLTNFSTIRKAIRKMASIDKMVDEESFKNISKKERLMIIRQRAKLEKDFGSITGLTRLPAAIFIVDITKEHIALAEAKKLNLVTFAFTDTNSDPSTVDFAIPSNDDSTKSITKIIDIVAEAIREGLAERSVEKESGSTERPRKIEAKKVVQKTKSTPDKEAKSDDAPKSEAKTDAAPAKEAKAEDKPVAKKEEAPAKKEAEKPAAKAKDDAPKAEAAPKAEKKDDSKEETKA
ncbi:MAG: 30S ribosomal protein S2 [Flavobacteriales bacterium]|nr:30S ribosomal protein S2 [Flavobacteriales bacterium]